jgi:hypothetical protein
MNLAWRLAWLNSSVLYLFCLCMFRSFRPLEILIYLTAYGSGAWCVGAWCVSSSELCVARKATNNG